MLLHNSFQRRFVSSSVWSVFASNWMHRIHRDHAKDDQMADQTLSDSENRSFCGTASGSDAAPRSHDAMRCDEADVRRTQSGSARVIEETTGHSADSHTALLEPIYNWFTEGFDTAVTSIGANCVKRQQVSVFHCWSRIRGPKGYVVGSTTHRLKPCH